LFTQVSVFRRMWRRSEIWLSEHGISVTNNVRVPSAGRVGKEGSQAGGSDREHARWGVEIGREAAGAGRSSSSLWRVDAAETGQTRLRLLTTVHLSHL